MKQSRSTLNNDYDWQLFLKRIRQARVDLGDPDVVWFRGHSKSIWTLTPSLMRDSQGMQREQEAFQEFQRSAARLFKKRDNDWETLFDMQHYGIPTRLLDWSEVLGVAVGFVVMASYDRSSQDAAVYVLDPLKLNMMSGRNNIIQLPDDHDFQYREIYWHNRPVAAQFPIAVYPPLQNERMFAQRATFTVHGSRQTPLESLCPDAVRQVFLPWSAIESAREFVEYANLNEYSLYPDIVGMARHIRRKIFMTG